jgi:hypothetical protein
MTIERVESGLVRFGIEEKFGSVWFGTMTIPGSFVTSSSTGPPPAAAHPPLRMHRSAEEQRAMSLRMFTCSV